MSRVKTIFLAVLVLSSLGFLSPSLFTSGVFCWSAQPVPALPKVASHTLAGAAEIDIPTTTAAHYILEIYGELAPRSEGFFTVNDNAVVPPRSVIVVPLLFTMIFAPKVSRYISISVLNI
jgi:hypothetical protein